MLNRHERDIGILANVVEEMTKRVDVLEKKNEQKQKVD